MKTGLVLEGGACRGVFTSGVLDVMMERGMTFDYCIGVSAGSGNAMNFKSHQPGRVLRLSTGDEEYYGLPQAAHSGKLLDLDLVYRDMSFEGDDPFDFHAYYENPMECEHTVTCCETGQPEYLSEEVYQNRLVEIVKASSSMPAICGIVALDGKHYLDGGIADPMPVFRALSRGCDRIVLVTTKPAQNLKITDYSRMRPLLRKLYKKKYPALYACLMTRAGRYYAELQEILELEKEGQVLMIRPEVCNIRALESDKEKMKQYYEHGREIMSRDWDKVSAYLA